MLLIITLAIFYLFCFFIPALKLRYDGINSSLASELQFSKVTAPPQAAADFSKIAFIRQIPVEPTERRLDYQGEKNCALFQSVYRSAYKNPKICIGYGDCVSKCPQRAISVKNGCAVVSNLCNGCGECLSSCPEQLISLIDRTEENNVLPEGKLFKFWYACYTLLKIKKR